MENKNYSFDIFISSSDNYSDLWPVFFQLFKLHWPDYNGRIYLNTETKQFSFPGLDIVCTCVGQGKPFGLTFNKGLEKIISSDIMLIMIDYFFMREVDVDGIKDAYLFFLRNDIDSLCLINQDYDHFEIFGNQTYRKIIPPSKDLFSFQIAFWKKSVLKHMVLNHENPWAAEWFGTHRANNRLLKLYDLSKNTYPPIVYDPAGCLHKGKWLENAVIYLKRLSIELPFEDRGMYMEGEEVTIKNRIKTKIMLVQSGLRGSFWK